MAEKNQKLNNLIGVSWERLNSLTDVNTVIGKPIITASGCQIIPFSKVTLGNLTGGGEYGDVKVIKETCEAAVHCAILEEQAAVPTQFC